MMESCSRLTLKNSAVLEVGGVYPGTSAPVSMIRRFPGFFTVTYLVDYPAFPRFETVMVIDSKEIESFLPDPPPGNAPGCPRSPGDDSASPCRSETRGAEFGAFPTSGKTNGGDKP